MLTRFMHATFSALALSLSATPLITPAVSEEIPAAMPDGGCWKSGEVLNIEELLAKDAPKDLQRFSWPEIERCIAAGADPDARTAFGVTLLYFSVVPPSWDGAADFIRLLLDAGADPNTVSEHDLSTPLHVAAGTGSTNFASLLLEAGADPSARDRCDRTPLHRAAYNGGAELVRLLLATGADPNLNTRDCKGRTPLDEAVRWEGNEDVVRILRNSGAE